MATPEPSTSLVAAKDNNPFKTSNSVALLALSIVWWIIAARYDWWRLILVIGLSLSAFMVGCLVAFLFTSYGEEAGTIGKIRDWLIGGITGLTVAKAPSIKAVLLTFTAGPGPSEFALAVSSATIYAVLGFFFMFFQRELILNVLLAQSRAERGTIEGTRQVGQVIKNFLIKLPPSILSGVDDISEVTTDTQKAELRKNLYSQEVQDFLNQAEEAMAQGSALDWDVVSKVANIQYYRTYFEDDKVAQAKKASEWISRALVLNPHHADFTMKQADTFATMQDYSQAVNILERMLRDPDAPVSVRQMLGFLLLYVPDRLGDSIKYSQQSLALTGDNDASFNIACAYAQGYCHPERGKDLGPPQENHAKALEYLRDALVRDPGYADTVKTKWTAKGADFECFAADKDFLALIDSVGGAAPQKDGTTAPEPGQTA